MVRRNMKQEGKFFLYNRLKRQFIQSSGAFDDGDGPEKYTFWTPYLASAMTFSTIKAARNMQQLLKREGIHVLIVDRSRGTVE